ncbi:MAG: peptide-methionine (R)-S-oxide reductase [Vulcanimicrobiota bacterium]
MEKISARAVNGGDDLRSRVMLGGKTEPPFTGAYIEHRQRGCYHCGQCGARLFASQWKFHSGCGWPSFFEAGPTVMVRPDPRVEDAREAACLACGGHLGHFFGSGHYCINSIALDFQAEDLESVLSGDYLRTWLGQSVENPDTKRRDERGATLLTYARTLEQTLGLVESGARVEDEKPEDGTTSVHRACESGQLEVVRLLFEAGADSVLELPDFIGRTPLACAAGADAVNVMQFLLDRGARLDAYCPRRQGVTPLFEAVWQGHQQAAVWLLKRGADADLAIGLNPSPAELARERNLPWLK